MSHLIDINGRLHPLVRLLALLTGASLNASRRRRRRRRRHQWARASDDAYQWRS